MTDPFRALMEERRREILILTRDAELSAGDIASHFSITRPAVSQHVKILLDAGLLEVRREKTVRYYRANPAGLQALQEFLNLFWNETLENLRRGAEKSAREKKSRARAKSRKKRKKL